MPVCDIGGERVRSLQVVEQNAASIGLAVEPPSVCDNRRRRTPPHGDVVAPAGTPRNRILKEREPIEPLGRRHARRSEDFRGDVVMLNKHVTGSA